jgi:hypothetical protein
LQKVTGSRGENPLAICCGDQPEVSRVLRGPRQSPSQVSGLAATGRNRCLQKSSSIDSIEVPHFFFHRFRLKFERNVASALSGA